MKRIKKTITLLIIASMVFVLASCGSSGSGSGSGNAAAEWTTTGYFENAEGDMVYIDKLEGQVEEGWYVMYSNPEGIYGAYLPQEGESLKGELYTDMEAKTDATKVTITPEGDGISLAIEGGDTIVFKPSDILERTFTVTINTEGYGWFNAVSDSEEAFSTEEDFTSQSAIINLQEPANYTLTAKAGEGYKFVKWTKNGQDFSTDPEVVVEFSEDAEFMAIFE